MKILITENTLIMMVQLSQISLILTNSFKEQNLELENNLTTA